MERFKTVGKFLARLFISAAILLWLFSRIDAAVVFGAFSRIPLPIWLVAFLLYLLSQVISSLRWFVIGCALGFGGRFITYLKFYFVGMYFNLFLPSAIGGDVLKAFFLSKRGNGKLKATYSIFADRLFGLWAMFIIGALAVTIHDAALPSKWRNILFFLALSMTIGALFMPFFKRFISRLYDSFKGKGGLAFKIVSALEYMLVFWKHPRSLFTALGLSLVLQFLGMTAAYLLGRGLGIHLDFAFYLSVLPLIAILTVLPISFSGLGVREGGFIYFFHLRGVPLEKALALSLSVFAIQAAAALCGGVGYMFGIHRKELEERS